MRQERQAVYQAQIQELTAQVETAQTNLADLAAQTQSLPAQITQLENTRQERQMAYQTQLQQLQDQYKERFAQLQAQLTEAQTRLAEAQAQLGQ
jgi:chromosome segregation ATPase